MIGWQTHNPVQPGQGPQRLALCMIVRDNADTLPACLESIRPWVDEMVVVDTGSQDETPRMAKRYGARVFHFPWCDDFSAARNESLRHARAQWVFWMDSDDTMDAENGRKLRELAYGQHDPPTLGYVMQVHCPAADSGSSDDVTVVDHVKMFPNHPQLRFDFRIHEQVLPSIRRLNGQVAWTDIFVVHSGCDHSAEGRRKKYDRDLRILALELEERSDHPFVLFNLGMTHEDMGRYEEACRHLRRCLELSDSSDSHVRKAYALLVSACAKLKQRDEAWQVCRRGRELFPHDPELAFRQGMLAHEMGRLEDAEKAYRAALADGEPKHFSSLDPSVSGYKARHNLALVYRDMGRLDLAEVQCRVAIDEAPRYGPVRRLLGDVLLEQGKFTAAEIQIERMDRFHHLRCDAAVLNADLAEHRGDVQAAREILEGVVREDPHSTLPLERLCRLLFHHGTHEEAQEALSKLIERHPDDGAARSNLAVLYLSQGRYEQAEQWLRESLRVRPDSAHTWVQLGQMLTAQGRHQQAREALDEAVGISPNDPATMQAVQQLQMGIS